MKCYLFDMANIGEDSVKIINKVFSLWKRVYGEELSRRSLPLHEEDFWNCRLLTVIEDDDSIVGALISNSFNLKTEVSQSHKYLREIPATRLSSFKESGGDYLMSMEYLLVNPDYRKNKAKVHWAEIIVGLGFKAMVNSPWTAVVGIAREDKGVSKMILPAGGNESDQLIKNQTPCRVVFVTKKDYRPHENREMRDIIDTLWFGKENFASALVANEDVTLRKAS